MLSESMACGPKGQTLHLALVEKWKGVPDGTPVIVTKDDGSEFKTKKRSRPWMLGASCRDPGHTAVMMVEGISGGYGLWRIRLDMTPTKMLQDMAADVAWKCGEQAVGSRTYLEILDALNQAYNEGLSNGRGIESHLNTTKDSKHEQAKS